MDTTLNLQTAHAAGCVALLPYAADCNVLCVRSFVDLGVYVDMG